MWLILAWNCRWYFWSWVHNFLPFCRELPGINTLYCRNFTYECHTFPLYNMFGHKANAFYCVILLNILLKITNGQRCPLGCEGAPWMRLVLKKYRDNKNRFYISTIRRGELSCYIIIWGNIIVCIGLVSRSLLLEKYKDSKNVQPCPPPSRLHTL